MFGKINKEIIGDIIEHINEIYNHNYVSEESPETLFQFLHKRNELYTETDSISNEQLVSFITMLIDKEYFIPAHIRDGDDEEEYDTVTISRSIQTLNEFLTPSKVRVVQNGESCEVVIVYSFS